MSKAKLKKELSDMSREQLIDIILNAYDARKEFKEYFEFFLNPDVGAMMSKVELEIMKECRKSKHSYAKFKITNIKNTIKNFQGLNPGVEHVSDMMLVTIFHLMDMCYALYVADKQYDTIAKFVADSLTYADKNGCFEPFVTRLIEFCKNRRFDDMYIKDMVIRAIHDHKAAIR